MPIRNRPHTRSHFFLKRCSYAWIGALSSFY